MKSDRTHSIKTSSEQKLAEDKLYKAEYVGSGTFIISKPQRKKTKMRQTKLKNLKRGSRK
jgi:preprotein translocase subunit YajC